MCPEAVTRPMINDDEAVAPNACGNSVVEPWLLKLKREGSMRDDVSGRALIRPKK